MCLLLKPKQESGVQLSTHTQTECIVSIGIRVSYGADLVEVQYAVHDAAVLCRRVSVVSEGRVSQHEPVLGPVLAQCVPHQPTGAYELTLHEKRESSRDPGWKEIVQIENKEFQGSFKGFKMVFNS